jgi:hypothetical protein
LQQPRFHNQQPSKILAVENLRRHICSVSRAIEFALAALLVLVVGFIFVNPAVVGPPAPQLGNQSPAQLIMLAVSAVAILLLAELSLDSFLQISFEITSEASSRLALICTRRC